MMVELTAPIAAALIDWRGLGEVVLFAVVAGLVIVGAFSFGVVGLDSYDRSRGGGEPADDGAGVDAIRSTGNIADAAMPVGVERPMVAFGSLGMAVIGFGICVGAVLIGILSLVHR
jgi:hypothetical protein